MIKPLDYDHLIFFHMLKTGGNTMKMILSRNYRKDEIFQFAKLGKNKGPRDHFENMPQVERDSIKVLRGHQFFGYHNYFSGKTLYFTLIREPVSRLISFYNHIHSLPNDYYRKLIPENERKTFGDFVINIDKYHDQGNNGQCRVIAGKDIKSSHLLETAKKNIENHFVFVGLTERFDESVLILGKYFNWDNPHYIKRKVSDKVISKNSISEDEIKLAKEKNKFDIQLYDKVKLQFKSMIEENIDYIKANMKRLERRNNLNQIIYSIGSPIKQKMKGIFN